MHVAKKSIFVEYLKKNIISFGVNKREHLFEIVFQRPTTENSALGSGEFSCNKPNGNMQLNLNDTKHIQVLQ